MAQPAAQAAAERRLTLTEILDWLVEDGVVARETAEDLKKERRYWRGTQHPLTLVAEAVWKDLRAPHRPLTLEALAEWLAKRVGLEYLHIDPLKINFSVVTEVMSSALLALPSSTSCSRLDSPEDPPAPRLAPLIDFARL